MAPLLIKIQRWLMQAHVWRFVGLTSSVVGLSCYARSSSCSHLFGRWNLLKIFLYSIFGIIVCLVILFAKTRPHSRSLQFEAHMACLVLTATSVYSFYFDKTVKGKPDTYSLISSAAFAVMSLSLSRQTRCGFEVDLLYFFLGGLIVQLMKIKLVLGVIGVGFSYSLVLLRSSLDSPSESEHLRLQDQYHVVVQVDSNSQHAVQVDSDSQQAAQVDSDSQEASIDIALIMPQLTACIEALKGNNWNLIEMLSKYVEEYNVDSDHEDHTPVDSNLVIDVLPPDVIDNLHEAVKLMLAAGFERECCEVYSSCRREYLSDCLRRHLPSIGKTETIHEFRIRVWIKTFNVAVRFLFPNERRLCERVFLGFPAAADLAFAEVCREFMIRQLNLANSFAVERPASFKAPKVLPRIPEAFRALHDFIPECESLFYGPSSDSIRNEAINTWKRLGRATRDIFEELEDWICRDEAMADIPGGVCPISCDVMDFISGVCEAWNTLGLEKVFEEHPMAADGDGTSFSLSTQLTRVMDLIGSHLEDKSKTFSDPDLRFVFTINNWSYIKGKAIACLRRTNLGNVWIEKINAKVEQDLKDYLRSTCHTLIRPLKYGSHEVDSVKSMQENLNRLIMRFKKIRRVQSPWFVIDEQLREDIKGSIRDILVPEYEIFIRRVRTTPDSFAHNYIEHSMFHIDALLKDLYSGGRWKRR